MAKHRKLTKAKRRAIANKNLAKARRLRWCGHKKHRHKKLTKAQHDKIRICNLYKARAARKRNARLRRKLRKHGHKR
jgi:hypothetical protein